MSELCGKGFCVARLVRLGQMSGSLECGWERGREERESLRSMCQRSCFHERACHHACVCVPSVFIHCSHSANVC